LTDVYYGSTEEDWNKITIGSANDALISAAIHFTEVPEVAVPVIASGVCGDNLTWTLYESGLLEITGTGAMYVGKDSPAPWKSYRSSVKTVIIDDSVTSIGDYAFYCCTSLASVTIGNSVTSIGNYAFEDCSSLASVTIPGSVTSIGEYAFCYCIILTDVYYGSTEEDWNKITIGSANDALISAAIHFTEVSEVPVPVIASGVCGPNLTWTLEDGVLTIDGTGEMYDFDKNDYIYVYIGGGSEASTGNTDVSVNKTTTAKITTDRITSTNKPTSVKPTKTETGTNRTEKNSDHITHPGYFDDDYYYTYSYSSNTQEPVIEETCTVRKEESTTAHVIKVNASESSTYREPSDSDYPAVDYPAVDYTTVEYTTQQKDYSDYMVVYRWNKHLDKIKKVVIGDGVTSIGDSAFADCTQLAAVEMSDSIISIGDYAFKNCFALTEIEIPKNVASVEEYAFYGCSALDTVNFNAEDCKILYSYYADMFYASPVKTLNVGTGVNNLPNIDTLETVNFADGATVVPAGAFSGCTKLTTVNLPDSIERIGISAFYGCDSLTSFVTPANTTYIGDFSFENCDSLAEVTIGENVEFISQNAFAGCYSLTVVNFNAKNCEFSVEGHLFYNSPVTMLNVGAGVNSLPRLSALETVTFADGATTVPYEAFRDCTKLTTVNLPDTVTVIDAYAFAGCSSLTQLELPENLTYIGYNAFYGCESLKEITIPENVTEIGGYAFSYCVSLSTLNYDAKNSYIDSYAFYLAPITVLNVGAGVDYLPAVSTVKTVTFAPGATKVPDNAFYNCTELTSVALPDSVETIGYRAFSCCTKLESIVLPKNLETIEENAFYACYNLRTADLPGSVTRIERCAFDNCSRLQSVVLPDSIQYIGEFAFYGCVSIKTLTIPEGLFAIGQAAFGCCYALESVEFNAINCCMENFDYYNGYGIFYNCDNISAVTFGAKVTAIPDALMKDKAKITSVVIPESVKSIGLHAFESTSIVTLELHSGIESISSNAFGNIGTLETIYFNVTNENCENNYFGTEIFGESGSQTDGVTVIFGETVKHIPGSLFCWNPYVRNVVFGPNVATIGDCAFLGCSGISSIELPKNLETIGCDAFYQCTSLTEVTIPENVTFIDTNAFWIREGALTTVNYNAVNCDARGAFGYNNSIRVVNVGDKVTRLSAYMFDCCENLERVYIPDVVIDIDPMAFDGCGKVIIVCKNGSYANVFAVQNNIGYIIEDDVEGTAFEIKSDMLLGYYGTAENIVLPSKTDSVGINAFKGNGFVKSIEIPYSVSVIYAGAFAECSALERVVVPFTVTEISDSAFDGTNATIYCYYNSYAYNYAVKNGINYELITVTLSSDSVNMFTGESFVINAVASVTLASGVPVVWKSSNSSVASVDSTGKIVGGNVGETTIGIYSFDGALFDECSVIVSEPVDELENVELNFEPASTDTVAYGEKIVLHINVADLPEGASVKWTSSNEAVLKTSNVNAECGTHEGCVTITVESVGNGSAEITATIVDENGEPILRDGEEIKASYTMNSKATFWQKLIAFFRKIFGISRIILQSVQ
ncbi:MAG: leucine-rich repeat protein, partial [Clostridia bacterium]|nr:leucine-rich repeat protein [Clostridia bacterium]